MHAASAVGLAMLMAGLPKFTPGNRVRFCPRCGRKTEVNGYGFTVCQHCQWTNAIPTTSSLSVEPDPAGLAIPADDLPAVVDWANQGGG